jgi:hypothetical protein
MAVPGATVKPVQIAPANGNGNGNGNGHAAGNGNGNGAAKPEVAEPVAGD